MVMQQFAKLYIGNDAGVRFSLSPQTKTSRMYEKIIKTKDAVKQTLIDHPKTRDDDRLLILKVWKLQYPNLVDMSFRQFSELYLNKKFKDTESIRRSRQKIQEQHPALRGMIREERQDQEKIMRNLITGLDT